MRCRGQLDTPVPLPGFVVSAKDPTLALPCPRSEACLGGNGSYCNKSYTGTRCARCVDGTYMFNNTCRECGIAALTWIFAVILPCMLVVGVPPHPNPCSCAPALALV
jgi:hypothetical protein